MQWAGRDSRELAFRLKAVEMELRRCLHCRLEVVEILQEEGQRMEAGRTVDEVEAAGIAEFGLEAEGNSLVTGPTAVARSAVGLDLLDSVIALAWTLFEYLDSEEVLLSIVSVSTCRCSGGFNMYVRGKYCACWPAIAELVSPSTGN